MTSLPGVTGKSLLLSQILRDCDLSREQIAKLL
jgi:hypothetical protein